jgi:hypothetical protein
VLTPPELCLHALVLRWLPHALWPPTVTAFMPNLRVLGKAPDVIGVSPLYSCHHSMNGFGMSTMALTINSTKPPYWRPHLFVAS